MYQINNFLNSDVNQWKFYHQEGDFHNVYLFFDQKSVSTYTGASNAYQNICFHGEIK